MKILIIEDEKELSDSIVSYLSSEKTMLMASISVVALPWRFPGDGSRHPQIAW